MREKVEFVEGAYGAKIGIVDPGAPWGERLLSPNDMRHIEEAAENNGGWVEFVEGAYGAKIGIKDPGSSWEEYMFEGNVSKASDPSSREKSIRALMR